jgi:hypothetical protein
MGAWGFIWLMFVLKIPIAMLLYLVWWAIHSEPEIDGTGSDDGGIRPHGQPPLAPDPRRRGPHGDPVVASPPRTRTPARSREPVGR